MKKTKKEVSANLVEKLWNVFLTRVSYARIYKDMIIRRGGNVVIDHLGFRSLNCHTGEQPGGIHGVKHIFESLGFSVARKYTFPGRKLNAVHLEMPQSGLPKIFISQLEVLQLPLWCRHSINETVVNSSYLLSDNGIELLNKLKTDGLLTCEGATVLLDELVDCFRCPWDPPEKDDVIKINEVNHYAAWVLLHGNAPSHYGVLINEQNARGWPDIKTISSAMQQAGIPMKQRIAGSVNSNLEQSATLAVKEEVVVKDEGMYGLLPWTYGYLELIRRSHDTEDKNALFGNFLEAHERQLYQMTVTLDN